MSALNYALVSLFLCLLICSASAQALKDGSRKRLTPVALQSEVRGALDGVLGPNDLVLIWALGFSEIPDKPLSIDEQGFIDVPMLGRLRAGGLTVGQFKKDLTERLREYIQAPQVSVTVTEFRSRPVSVIGAVNTPGVHQLQGQKTLIEALSAAGGLRPDAGNSIKLTRRKEWGPIPIPSAKATEEGYSIGEINVKDLIDAKEPELNVVLCPYDIISVPRADTVYVVGEVQKPGAFAVSERGSYSVLQALTMAGGLTSIAAPRSAKILRDSRSATREQIPVDLKKLLNSRNQDVVLKAGDILFVPNSAAKSVGRKAVDAAIQLAVGVAVFRR
ncbi:MAG: SLBB domain-containing protein [Bryobacteraceae bacterium]